jgi:hypothetical protein
MNSVIIVFCSLVFLFGFSFSNQNNGSDNFSSFEPGVPVIVGSSAYNTSFGYYNTTPESPDGSKIAYTKFLSSPKNDRAEQVPAEIWICSTALSEHKKVADINALAVHNGARIQWLDNRSFAYEDDSIRVIDTEGTPLIKAVKGRIGHESCQGKILYAANDPGTQLSTIYEYDIPGRQIIKLGDVMDFKEVTDHYPSENLREVSNFNILHLQYSQNGKKIAFRLDIGLSNEKYKHLVIMNKDKTAIRYFGPKPMHFSWFDNESIVGHDNQIDDNYPNDKSARRWDLERNVIETLSGTGNHLGASFDRQLYASETWYQQIPVILSVYKRGETVAFWQDTISQDHHTTWELAFHANPSFSRDGKRVYFNKCTAPGKVNTYMVVLPKN